MSARALVGAAALAALAAACAGGRTGGRTAGESSWLRETGFAARAEWPSAILHADRRAMAGVGGLGDVVRRAPDVVVRAPEGEGWGVHRRPAGGELCEVAVVLNGTRVRRLHAFRGWTLDGLIGVRDLDGVELHVGGEGPVVDETGCGTLLLWSEAALGDDDVPFDGAILGRVTGAGADTVVAVALEPGGEVVTPDRSGRFAFAGLRPGVYEVAFMTRSGALSRQGVRVWAYADTRADLEVGRPFPYETDVAVVFADAGGAGCLSAAREIAPGTRLLLVGASDTEPAVLRARVGEPRSGPCALENELATQSVRWADVTSDAALEPFQIYFALVGAAFAPRLSDDRVWIDLDADGVEETFRACTSAEGLHLAIWSGEPGAGERRWHRYLYLGYDVEPTCTDADFPARETP